MRAEETKAVSVTNRDLYIDISNLDRDYAAHADRTLEEYLRALLGLVRQYCKERSHLHVSGFYNLLDDAFAAPPLPFAPAWRDAYDDLDPDLPGFAGWEATIIRQIVDLREMQETGIMENPLLVYDTQSPRGSEWESSRPFEYLDNAAAGTFGFVDADAPPGRLLSKGDVAILDADGAVQSVGHRNIVWALVEMKQSPGRCSRIFCITVKPTSRLRRGRSAECNRRWRRRLA